MSRAPLHAIRTGRRMPFLKRGMRINVDGAWGRITGGNSAMNVNVRFDGERYSKNCHPWWQTTYYDAQGAIIADYKQKPGDSKDHDQ